MKCQLSSRIWKRSDFAPAETGIKKYDLITSPCRDSVRILWTGATAWKGNCFDKMDVLKQTRCASLAKTSVGLVWLFKFIFWNFHIKLQIWINDAQNKLCRNLFVDTILSITLSTDRHNNSYSSSCDLLQCDIKLSIMTSESYIRPHSNLQDWFIYEPNITDSDTQISLCVSIRRFP